MLRQTPLSSPFESDSESPEASSEGLSPLRDDPVSNSSLDSRLALTLLFKSTLCAFLFVEDIAAGPYVEAVSVKQFRSALPITF